jgi:hypothetical protein
MHGFFTMVGLLPAQQAAMDHVADRIDQFLSQEIS